MRDPLAAFLSPCSISLASRLLGLTDGQIGAALDLPRSTVNAWRLGRYPEALDEAQRRKLINMMRDRIDDLTEAIELLLTAE